MTITYFITGTNRGIGFEFAKQLSEDPNNNVIATTRSFAKATALKDLNRSNLHIIEYDVASPLETMKRDLLPLEKYAPDGVDVVIHNAAICIDTIQPILQTTEAELNEHYTVNATGSVKVYQSIFPYWSKSANSETAKKFIFISSIAGYVNNFCSVPTSHYGSSKAALNHIVRHIAFDHKSSDLDHIQKSIVFAVHPGLVETDMGDQFVTFVNEKGYPVPVITPRESASNVIKIIQNLSEGDDDTFISYDGNKVTW
ncbi:NAD(P)-binding protein [Hyphopichia burtonii NRRL Y-1933]|uniref:NAD(P)-binding protein n=1 Tax=Hyphopichia burtonii NRRL Y-1933 TaxID=984485 RepID=A0A1E4RBE9_9ASCO|nr:NAD(P)-binding protein [Hyphopichia burtonii NRRL Y-1933]ODV64578.1 NAD(P)-binding protein [Hyphopichia burtonii NRRL Y-1933]